MKQLFCVTVVSLIIMVSSLSQALELRINAGGPAYTDQQGQLWAADRDYNTGRASLVSGVDIQYTNDDPLYRARRFDLDTLPELEYSIDIPNGTYQVNLYFVETYSGAFGPDLRVFDVFLENQRVLANFDIYRTAGGGNKALIKPFTNIKVQDGKLNLRFQHRIQNPMIAAIEITGDPDFTVPNPGNDDLPFQFNSQDLKGWTVTNDTGVNANWILDNGMILQTVDAGNQAFGNPKLESSNIGSHLALNGYESLSNYRIDTDLIPLRDSPILDMFDGKDVGVMFRYQDAKHYYRLSINAREAYTRLEKRVGDKFITLAENARGYREGQRYQLAIITAGPLILIKLDGENLFSVYDNQYSRGTIALYSQDKAAFDNIRLNGISENPLLSLGEPLAYSVQTDGRVRASAVVLNRPAGSYLEFDFGGQACTDVRETPVGSGHFTSDCGWALQGDYRQDGLGLIANLYSANGNLLASDQHRFIGIQGHKYLAVGDSITLGTYDLYSGDNESEDDRIIGQQGFHAQLNDLLTSSEQVPHLVINAGVGGDRTTDSLKRIDSILSRHNNADRMLLMLGTNDASGTTPLPLDVYQENMQRLVNKAISQGLQVWVPQIPPSLPASNNPWINKRKQAYNEAIKQLTGISPGPDFYQFFYDDNGTASTNDDYERASLYYDQVHPNALGQQVMAQLWHNAITGQQTQPFYLDKLCNRLHSRNCNDVSLTNHKQTILATGYPYYYIDQGFQLQDIPAPLKDSIWIQTANSEVNNRAGDYISFHVDRPVTVYIGYDGDAAMIPFWMWGFSNTGTTISSNDPKTPTLKVYAKDFNAGMITLGGNQAFGAINVDSNYIVAIKQRYEPTSNP